VERAGDRVTNYNTSRVFEAARRAKERLTEQSWPTHPATGDEPQITFTDPDIDGQGEIIWLIPDIGDDAAIEVRSLPNGRNEMFDLVFTIYTDALVTDEFDEDACLDRLEELADVVQRAFYNDNETVDRWSLLTTSSVSLEGFTKVSFSITPTEGGMRRGVCEIRYRTAHRI
jgi:hypothetical protein